MPWTGQISSGDTVGAGTAGCAAATSSEARRDLDLALLLLEPEYEKILDDALRRNEGDFFGRGVRSQKVSGTKRNRRPKLNPTMIATILQKQI